MKAESINTWPTFLNVQFFSLIEKCFQWGAETVVLGFDNYNHVPVSKTMTQIKRNKHVPVFKFNHTDELPTYMPSDWNSAMRNRTFKVRGGPPATPSRSHRPRLVASHNTRPPSSPPPPALMSCTAFN